MSGLGAFETLSLPDFCGHCWLTLTLTLTQSPSEYHRCHGCVTEQIWLGFIIIQGFLMVGEGEISFCGEIVGCQWGNFGKTTKSDPHPNPTTSPNPDPYLVAVWYGSLAEISFWSETRVSRFTVYLTVLYQPVTVKHHFSLTIMCSVTSCQCLQQTGTYFLFAYRKTSNKCQGLLEHGPRSPQHLLETCVYLRPGIY